MPDRLYKLTKPAGITAYYNDEVVTDYFISTDSTSLRLDSATTTTGSISVSEILRNYYTPVDGGTWAYQPAIDRWTSRYSFQPEWMSMVSNRLVSFHNGKPYVHDGDTCEFYGNNYDACVAFVHNEQGSTPKTLDAIAVEGDMPDWVHVRTEVPYVQSSDLAPSDFQYKEGVYYTEILRDRLSPNASGTANEKMYFGDRMRGTIGKFMVWFFQPSTTKTIRFANIEFTPSRGQTV